MKAELHRTIQELNRCCRQPQCTALVSRCSRSEALEAGRRMHSLLARDGKDQQTFVGNLIVQMYSHCSDVVQAKQAFERIGKRNLFSWSIMISAYASNGHLKLAAWLLERAPMTSAVLWNTMISGHAQGGDLDRAREHFRRMPERDVASWNSMISALVLNGLCTQAVTFFLAMDLEGITPNKITFLNVLDAVDSIQLELLHEEVRSRELEVELLLGTTLVKTYGRLNLPEQAIRAFDGILNRNVVCWNTLVEASSSREAFGRMPHWDLVSWTLLLASYAREGHLLDAFRIFISMPERSSVSWNAILSGCTQHGSVNEAELIFEMMPQRNVVTWTTMIFGGDQTKSLRLFREMDLEGLQPNRITFLSLIDGFGSLQLLKESRAVHLCAKYEGLASDPEVMASLIRMYGRCQSLDDARSLFLSSDRSPHMHNTMLCTLSGREALLFMSEMDLKGIEVLKSSLIAAIESCNSLVQGRNLHSSICSELVLSDISLGTSLMYMYGRLGDVITARTIFDKLHQRNLVTWTALVSTYAQNGRGDLAVENFRHAELDGIIPDAVTFAKIIVACSHAGLVTPGYHFFGSFIGDYGLVPELDHYNCLIDMLCRNGRLLDAQQVAVNMPFEPNLVSWVTVLGGCSVHSNSEMAFGAAQQASRLDERNTASYSLLSNICKIPVC